uniref:Putative secreted peptide n=1 Tax=Anopheles braziliensis TaxID=58242 RepID=A0A2M3ZWL2_9DIPT
METCGLLLLVPLCVVSLECSGMHGASSGSSRQSNHHAAYTRKDLRLWMDGCIYNNGVDIRPKQKRPVSEKSQSKR